MSTVEEVVSTSYTPEQCKKRRRSMILAVAAGRRHEIDPTITEAAGCFAIDDERDLAGARRRVEDSKRIEAAQQRLAELKANPPVPPPNGRTLLTEFRTLGELAAAVFLLNNRNTLWGPQVDHDHAVSEAEATIKRAESYLRATSDLSIDESIRSAKRTIERTHQAIAERTELQERLANLKALLDRANPRSEQERAAILSQRAEYADLSKRLAALPEPDHEAIATAEAEIEKLAESQLDAANLQFSDPSGKQQGIYPTPCRFS